MDTVGLKDQCPAADIADRQPDMAIDEIHYKRWRIEVLRGEPSWKTLLYYPDTPLHGAAAPDGTDRRAVMKEAEALADGNQLS
jgi:hypothetical protein